MGSGSMSTGSTDRNWSWRGRAGVAVASGARWKLGRASDSLEQPWNGRGWKPPGECARILHGVLGCEPRLARGWMQ